MSLVASQVWSYVYTDKYSPYRKLAACNSDSRHALVTRTIKRRCDGIWKT